MLLTVIAVATLLVAVVGATFAYFSLTVSGDSATTQATVTTGKTGMFTVENKLTDLKLNITATNMNQVEESIDYFADSTAEAAGTPKVKTPALVGDVAPDSEYFATFEKLSLSNVDNGTKYHCEGKYTISVDFKNTGDEPADATTDKNQVLDADGRLYLNAKETAGVTISIKDDNEGKPADEGVTAISHTLKSLLAQNKDFWVTYDYTSSGATIDAELQAALKVTNTTAPQNYLAGKTITVTLTPSASDGKLKCDIVNN